MTGTRPRISRRGLGLMCLGGLAAGAAGCTRSGSPGPGTPASRPTVSVAPASPAPPPAAPSSSGPSSPGPFDGTPTTRPALPAATRWRPQAGEVEPEAKLRAVRVIEAIGSWTDGRGTQSAADRVASLGEHRRLAAQAAALVGPADRAVVRVIDAQYGGILADAASVLVVCRQWRATGRSVSEGGTTVDVRLLRSAGRWRVTALHPARPGPPARHPTAAATAVLGHDRIDLPPASVADVRSGRVHDSVLTALLQLAGSYRIGISVIRSGHPLHVFGTNRLSDHPQGRAFDTWRVDGHPVADPATPPRLIIGYMHAAAAAGSYNVGGPYLLAGSGSQFFSDATHHDHVHAGFPA